MSHKPVSRPERFPSYERGLEEFSLIDITSFAKDGSTRSVRGYRAVRYNIPRGSAAGYMPELNVLCPIGDYSVQSDQPLMKHLIVEVTPTKAPNTAHRSLEHAT